MNLTNFWLLLTLACVAWYSTITLYIAWRGAIDIRQMLRRLATSQEIASARADQESAAARPPKPPGDI